MRALPRLDLALLKRLGEGMVADLLRMLSVGVVLVIAATAIGVPEIRQWLSLGGVTNVLALVSVAFGVVGAISCGVLGQLDEDARGLWLGVAIAVYSTIGIPAATLNAAEALSDAAIGNVRLLAHILLVVLTFVAVFAAVRPPWDGWLVLCVAGVMTAAAAGWGLAFPTMSLAVTTNQAVRYGVCVAWVLSTVAVVLASWLCRSSWLSWVGMGCTVIALAHTLRVTAGSPLVPLGPEFSALRLVGVALLVLGTARTTRRALVALHRAHNDYQEKLWLAERDLEQVERRAHDVRNGLAGLAGVTVLLEVGAQRGEEMAILRDAVAVELTRLHALLRPSSVHDSSYVPAEYEVEPVLSQQVALQSSTGADVRLDAECGLHTVGNPSVLTQVLNNVLANCAQHAAGSPVRVQARAVCDVVQIRVRDSGPGIPPGFESQVFEMGVHGPCSGGQGLGLHISRTLLAAERGVIEIRTPSSGTGCEVLIELPVAPRQSVEHLCLRPRTELRETCQPAADIL